MIQGWRKQINSIRLLTYISRSFFWFETQNINTHEHHKKFHSFIAIYLLTLKQQTWKCKRKYILCQFWNTLAMSIFETLGWKLKVLSSIIFVALKLIWSRLTPSPPNFFFYSSPHTLPPPPPLLCLTHLH